MWTDPNEFIGDMADDEPGCTIGTQCKPFEAGKRNIIILFGGVGSHKGDLTDLMASEYNFHLICMEELVSARSTVCLTPCCFPPAPPLLPAGCLSCNQHTNRTHTYVWSV